jgi:hypothetical protein
MYFYPFKSARFTARRASSTLGRREGSRFPSGLPRRASRPVDPRRFRNEEGVFDARDRERARGETKSRERGD